MFNANWDTAISPDQSQQHFGSRNLFGNKNYILLKLQDMITKTNSTIGKKSKVYLTNSQLADKKKRFRFRVILFWLTPIDISLTEKNYLFYFRNCCSISVNRSRHSYDGNITNLSCNWCGYTQLVAKQPLASGNRHTSWLHYQSVLKPNYNKQDQLKKFVTSTALFWKL